MITLLLFWMLNDTDRWLLLPGTGVCAAAGEANPVFGAPNTGTVYWLAWLDRYGE